MKEIWKDIKGYEGLYQVSNLGNVRSVDRVVNYKDGRKRLWKGRILKPKKDRYGYLLCDLCKKSKVKTITIHRLVAETFLPNPNNLPEINHKDENKDNNCVSNLEFCSHLYNMRFGTAIQRRVEKVSKPVLQIDLETNKIIDGYPSANEAARKLKIDQGGISYCCRGKYKTYKGFKWQYK